MPLVAAVIGYSTKRLLIWMIFSPEEFRGIGPIGWQGVVPRNAAKIGSIAMGAMFDRLLKPTDLLDRIDPEATVAAVEQPLSAALEATADEVADRYYPTVWRRLPQRAKRAVLMRVRRRAPDMLHNLIEDMRGNVEGLFDLRFLVVSNLVRNKSKLNQLMREMVTPELNFIRRSGIVFGSCIGLVQMTVWATTHNEWVMPLFGLVTGGTTDWLALQMLFRPIEPKRYFGLFRWHGLLHRRRPEITRAYARMGAGELLHPSVLMEMMLVGPPSDRLLAKVGSEVQSAIDAETGAARPLITFAVGDERYSEIKRFAARQAVDSLPAVAPAVQEHALRTLDTEKLVAERMSQMDPDQYEGIMRPAFKDNEWLVVALGALLGFAVGELQLALVTHL
jgi:uncharacterized membrane protein YheB (UPF0754 family)